jgi:tetratricopeptide (TPR) repeat protein
VRTWLIGLAVLLVLGTALGAYLRWPAAAPVPPEIPHDGLEPAVIRVAEEARGALMENPRSADAWGYLGRVLLANGACADVSLVCFLQAERLAPDNTRWPYLAGLQLLELSRPEDALAKLERAVALGERRHSAIAAPRLALADTLRTLGRVDEAAIHYRQALARDPEDPRAHFGLGMGAFALEQWQEARVQFESCVHNHKTRKRASARLATICQRLNDTSNADFYARLATRLPIDAGWTDPFTDEDAHLAVRKEDRTRMIQVMEDKGLLPNAVALLRVLIAENPQEYRLHMDLGRLLAKMGQYEAAEKEVAEARRLGPDNIDVVHLMGLLLFKKGETLWLTDGGDREHASSLFEASIGCERRVLAIRPDHGLAHAYLGLSLKFLDRKTDALAAFRQAVHCNPELADTQLFLGLALAEAGNLSEARVHLDQALRLATEDDARPRAALEQYFSDGSKSKK